MIGSLLHLMLSGEEPWESKKNLKSILDLICFNKRDIPYLRIPEFPISRKIRNSEMRILLRNTLERNQLKRIYLGKMEENIKKIFNKTLFYDFNLDSYDKQLYRKGTLISLDRSPYFQKNIQLFPFVCFRVEQYF
jgi:hypothetical protein